MTGAAGPGSMDGAQHPLRVAVVYHVWPHYRRPVMQAMDRSASVAYDFFGSGDALDGVLHADTDAVSRFVRAPFRRLGRFLWQSGAVGAARDPRYQALILLADPNFASNWVAALIARLRRRPVLFWGHGWTAAEGSVKQAMRRACFSLADRILVYAERGKRLGIAAGFPEDRITVVYNSLDVDRADAVVAAIEGGVLASAVPQAFFADQALPVLICTARLTPACRFDLLLAAAALLSERGLAVNVLLVGDGPEREKLEKLARQLGVAVHFLGACYEEETIGQLIYHSAVTVSPGKIGLTAMHSLMYGTPAITHGDLDAQMPEVEAIEDRVTGAFFRRNDAVSLADTIERWLAAGCDRNVVRQRARAAIRAKWTPQVQARIIEQAVLEVAGRAA